MPCGCVEWIGEPEEISEDPERGLQVVLLQEFTEWKKKVLRDLTSLEVSILKPLSVSSLCQ